MAAYSKREVQPFLDSVLYRMLTNQIQKLNEENEGLESMKSQTEKQIAEIGRIVG